jgi:hypothetical protein
MHNFNVGTLLAIKFMSGSLRGRENIVSKRCDDEYFYKIF